LSEVNWTTLAVFLALLAFITWLGFRAARWQAGDLDKLLEWSLAGRRFGTVVTWFLLGGDLYTAYTYIALPAFAFGAGAIAFYSVPTAILAMPVLYFVYPRLWQHCQRHGYLTAGDFVRGRFGNRWLALAVSLTGIIATMPYIGVQLIGMRIVIGALGFSGSGIVGDLPLIAAFIVLAAFTFASGLRAPASIAIVKDVLVYVTAFAALIIVPIELGGFGKIFAAIPPEKLLLPPPGAGTVGVFGAYVTMAIGSGLANALYPHTFTGILSAHSDTIIRRNVAMLPSYTFVLGLLGVIGFFVIASGVANLPQYAGGFARYGADFAVPALFMHSFPAWFTGVAFAAIATGALVPAAIMSIGTANLYTRNIHREFFNPAPTEHQETQIAKIVSLLVKLGALAFILLVPTSYAIELQLLGGVWVVQTLPTVMLGAFTRRLNSWALLLGWAAGVVVGTAMAVSVHFAPVYRLTIGGFTVPGYTGFLAVVLNLAVVLVVSPFLNRRDRGRLPAMVEAGA
jgi:SSS family solute:Na+ symporter